MDLDKFYTTLTVGETIDAVAFVCLCIVNFCVGYSVGQWLA
jgi:hypothetical protein